jgi:hypothetical protein
MKIISICVEIDSIIDSKAAMADIPIISDPAIIMGKPVVNARITVEHVSRRALKK